MQIDGPSIISGICTVASGLVLARMRLDAKGAARRDRIAAETHAACEARFTALSAEIARVRDGYQQELVGALRDQTAAMAEATTAQRESNHTLDRVCRRLESLPCARDQAERRPLQDPTPQAHDALPEHRSHHP